MYSPVELSKVRLETFVPIQRYRHPVLAALPRLETTNVNPSWPLQPRLETQHGVDSVALPNVVLPALIHEAFILTGDREGGHAGGHELEGCRRAFQCKICRSDGQMVGYHSERAGVIGECKRPHPAADPTECQFWQPYRGPYPICTNPNTILFLDIFNVAWARYSLVRINRPIIVLHLPHQYPLEVGRQERYAAAPTGEKSTDNLSVGGSGLGYGSHAHYIVGLARN